MYRLTSMFIGSSWRTLQGKTGRKQQKCNTRNENINNQEDTKFNARQPTRAWLCQRVDTDGNSSNSSFSVQLRKGLFSCVKGDKRQTTVHDMTSVDTYCSRGYTQSQRNSWNAASTAGGKIFHHSSLLPPPCHSPAGAPSAPAINHIDDC